jgi:hypothetical protein
MELSDDTRQIQFKLFHKRQVGASGTLIQLNGEHFREAGITGMSCKIYGNWFVGTDIWALESSRFTL